MKNNEKSRGCTYKIANISVATCCTELNFVPIEYIEKELLPSGIQLDLYNLYISNINKSIR